MSLLPPVGWADVATKHDIDVVRRDIDRLDRTLHLVVGWLIASQAAIFIAVCAAVVLRAI